MQYSLSQLLMRIKMNTMIIYFFKKVYIKINQIQNIFNSMIVYCKCFISIELTFLQELMLTKSVIFVTIGIS